MFIVNVQLNLLNDNSKEMTISLKKLTKKDGIFLKNIRLLINAVFFLSVF